MKFRVLECEFNGRKFRIEEDLPEVGFYLYNYENDECTADYLQDRIEMCKDFANEEYGVPFDCWIELEPRD